MNVQEFEKIILENIDSKIKDKWTNEWIIHKYRFENGTIVNVKELRGKVTGITAKGRDSKKILEIFKKTPKNI